MPSQTTAAENSPAGVGPKAPWRLAALTVLPDYRLAVTFNDGRKGIVDFSALLQAKDAGIFAELAEPQFFAKAFLFLGVASWPNGADIDPAWMYEMLGQAEVWMVPF